MAITAALLVGLGFNPLYAAGLCLIVNTAPVAFGAMGIPILVAGQVTGIDSFAIGQMVGRQLPFLTIIVLFWIMAIMDGWRGIKETGRRSWLPAARSPSRSTSALTSLARNCRTSSPLWCHWFA